MRCLLCQPKKNKPAKPRPDWPLTAHNNGQWCKKIRGKVRFFGVWSEPDAALRRYIDERDHLMAGLEPPTRDGGISILDLCTAFLDYKIGLVNSGELSPATVTGYRTTAKILVRFFEPRTSAVSLRPADFLRLRDKLAETNGPIGLKNRVIETRMVFKFADDMDLIEHPIKLGKTFSIPRKKTIRQSIERNGQRLYTAEQIRELIADASPTMRAMIYLGINCGFLGSDCGALTFADLDLDTGWHDFRRPKTDGRRRCWLWPETVAAIRESIQERPTPRGTGSEDLIFINSVGGSYRDKNNRAADVSRKFRALVKNKIWYRPGMSFRWLRRHTQTIGDMANEPVATKFIMGHLGSEISELYREYVAGERLRRVSECIREWLFC
jgi:integrase